MSCMSRKYRNISIHEEIAKQIEIIIEETNYRSISDFLHDAIRRRIEQLFALYPELKSKLQSTKSKD